MIKYIFFSNRLEVKLLHKRISTLEATKEEIEIGLTEVAVENKINIGNRNTICGLIKSIKILPEVLCF